MSIQCISAFENLPTLHLPFPFPHDRITFDLVVRCAKMMSWELELLWDVVKYVAISQLQGSLAEGPKMLRAAVVFLGS